MTLIIPRRIWQQKYQSTKKYKELINNGFITNIDEEKAFSFSDLNYINRINGENLIYQSKRIII